MIRIFLDTNVLISATFWYGSANKVIISISKKKISAFTTNQILDEYRKVIKRDFNHSEEEADERIAKLLEVLEIVSPSETVNFIKDDPSDNKVLEGALEASAGYILTYDAKHLLKIKEFKGIKIISPEEFLKLCEV